VAREDARASIEALDCFARMQNRLGGIDFVAAPMNQPPLVIAGLVVHVDLDFVVHRTHDSGAQIGAALFRYSRGEGEGELTAAKRRDLGAYATTLVSLHVAESLAGARTPHHQLCLFVDIPREEIYVAPRSFAKRAQNLESACRVILELWEKASPQSASRA
jgi:hypothetical protein